MRRKKEREREYVLDSYALLVYLQKQQGWQEIGQLLRNWRRHRREARLSWINWGEIYYLVRRRFGLEKALETIGLMSEFPVVLEAVDFELVRQAAELKAVHEISYADAFCVATALRYDAILVTGDPDFKSLEGILDIRWL